MFKIVFFISAVSFGWYQLTTGHGNSQNEVLVAPELTAERIELLRRIAGHPEKIGPVVFEKQHVSIENQSGSYALNDEAQAAPELTNDRVELLRRIAGMPNENELAAVNAPIQNTNIDDPFAMNGNSAIPAGFEMVSKVTTGSEWQSYLGVDQYSGAKEGFAFSRWTTLSPNHNWPDEKIQAALVAGCKDDGERSLYIRMLSVYPGSEADNVSMVEGQIGWDSSDPYGAPFTYDVGLNALRLRAGIEDSFSMIKDGNTVTIQIPWYDSNQAAFKFSLKGSSQALNSAFDYCSSSQSS